MNVRMWGMRTLDIEIAAAEYFGPRANVIVPNVSWGMGIHECDLLVMTKSGCLYEVEIKVTKSDLVRDAEKRHGHSDRRNRIKGLYFAIPDSIIDCQNHIPERAGILVVDTRRRCKAIRFPKIMSSYSCTDKEQYEFARLGALRIWNLKRNILGQGCGYDYYLDRIRELEKENKRLNRIINKENVNE